MATHSSILTWRIPWTEEPGRLQSMGSQRVGHDWTTSLSLSCIAGGNGNLLQCSCLENPKDGGAWWAAIYGVAQSRTRMTWLSSSSNLFLLSHLFFPFFLLSPLPLCLTSSSYFFCSFSYFLLPPFLLFPSVSSFCCGYKNCCMCVCTESQAHYSLGFTEFW